MTIHLGELSHEESYTMWNTELKGIKLSKDVDIHEIANKFTLNPLQIRRASAEACMHLIRDRAEDRKQEYGKHVVDRHDRPRRRLRESEVVGENKRNDGIVCLPKGRNQKECHTDKQNAFVVQFHSFSSLSEYFGDYRS